MTRGHGRKRHRHWSIRLHRNSRVLRVLLVTIYTTSDRDKAERSPFVYRPGFGHRYRVTLLGVLHGLTGLQIDVKE